MEYIKQVTLDISPEEHWKYVHVKQGDNLLRKIAISLTSDGATYDPGIVDHAWFRIEKPDGKAVILQSNGTSPKVTVSNNVYTIALTQQSLVAAGRAICDLVLFDANDGIISSVSFYMMIEAAPNTSHILASSNEFADLQKAIVDVEELLNSITFASDQEIIEYLGVQ